MWRKASKCHTHSQCQQKRFIFGPAFYRNSWYGVGTVPLHVHLPCYSFVFLTDSTVAEPTVLVPPALSHLDLYSIVIPFALFSDLMHLPFSCDSYNYPFLFLSREKLSHYLVGYSHVRCEAPYGVLWALLGIFLCKIWVWYCCVLIFTFFWVQYNTILYLYT